MTRTWTPSQQSAIRSRARTLVTAAAGSGKTSVLTELVAQALVAREIAPAEVCAVTFTEKAAQEMRERITHRLGELGERDLLAEFELARIGTIHSLCAIILRGHGAAVGVDPGVGLLDEAQHAWIIRAAVRSAIEHSGTQSDVHWLRARMGDERIEQLLREIYRIAAQGDGTASLPDPSDARALLDEKTGEAVVSADAARRTLTALELLWHRFAADVQGHKHALGRISFDDLERLAVEAVRIPTVRTALRAQWGMLLVDEFQDTNARQYELLDTIGADRLFMVGDEWQSIYRFRGADIDVFRARREDAAGGVVVPMRENFRSAAPVLDVVNRVFSHELVFGERYEDVHAGTDAQRAVDGPSVDLLVTPENDVPGAPLVNERHGREREAMRVAERIAGLVDSGAATPGEIAVLYARGTGAGHFERALQAWGLPVLRAASGDFYDQRDVRDVLALLALVRNGRDDHAALAVLSGPVGRLDWSALAELVDAARASGCSLLEAMRASTHPGAHRACAVLDVCAHAAARDSLVQLVTVATQQPEFELGAALDHDGVLRVANLRRLVTLASSAHQVGVHDVADFLEFVAAQRRDARVGEATIADETAGAIRLMTVHASKGLEFPHVFVVEAAAGTTGPSSIVPAPLVDSSGTVHVPLPGFDGRCIDTPALSELRLLDRSAEREESLRLWYVAMTRAKQHLYISGRWDFEPTKAGKPRAMGGALAWLRDTLGLDPALGGADRCTTVLDGLVTLDTRPAREIPRVVWNLASEHTRLAEPKLVLDIVAADDAGTPDEARDEPDPHALRTALQEAVGSARSDEWRQLDGTRVHDAVARLLDAARTGTPVAALLDPTHGPWLTDLVRERLTPVVESPVFARLVELGARTEVPYVASTGATVASRVLPGSDVAATVESVDAGRIDALARPSAGECWIVDWKTTLAHDPDLAWREHGQQLLRYARAVAAPGVDDVRVTLVPLDRPDDALTWRIAFDAPGDAASTAVATPCALP